MQCSCDLVQDLYPLYVAGDLSSTVQKEVDEHLKECSSCNSIYNRGEGFDEERHLNELEVDVPKSLDDRVQMRMKLRRLKFIVLVLCSVLFLIIVNHYLDQRKEEVFTAFHDVYGGAEYLQDVIGSTPEASGEELNFLKDMYSNRMFKGIHQLTDSLNWFEDQKLKGSSLYIKQQSFYTTLDNLNLRKKDGRWDDVDQKTYDLLVQYAAEYMLEVTEDYKKFNHGYSSYFETVDVKNLSKPVESINRLSYTYNRFHELPDQVQQLSEDDLTNRIADVFQVDPEEVSLEKDYDYRYQFRIENESISGEVDAFSGYPIRLSSYDSPDAKGELLEVDQVQSKVEPFLDKIYGENKAFSIEYLGINVNYSSNIDVKYYSFRVMPLFESLPVYAFSDRSLIVNFDARSGELRMMHSIEDVPLPLDFSVDVNEQISPKQGLKVLQDKVEIEDKELAKKRMYDYEDTYVIYSSTSGGFVPVHAYGLSDHDHTWRYINIENGKEELLYNKY
ncbi:zf-HC2 domain-containing protein [Alkalihalobacillus sp. AL-G]|uniref:zf-HC2 domain-containing protein n=1 Tax=Alkalihalobacillus sp. AL-G TaxID=2926399 RepID=UPI00272D62CE|nr:zf-HC2 domain-containing protein [Alkalihalobacillus sp. AL-G]WLD95364.1 zf-HC2 domain-containing protein [Alkalihalobacillus sp. AL-G]